MHDVVSRHTYKFSLKRTMCEAMGSLREYLGGALTLAIGLVAPSCGHAEEHTRASDPEIAARAVRTSLDDAVDRYHATGEIGALRAWIEHNPEHDDAGLWREVVALRMYEAIVIGDPQAEPAEPQPGEDPAVAPLPEPDASRLLSLAAAFPDTIGGQTAQALLEDVGLRELTHPPINPTLVRFLEGDDAWAPAMPNVDLGAFRERHEDRLRDRFAGRLIEDGCSTTLGYCTWWVEHFPDDALTLEIRVQMKAVWNKRAHPPWKGRNYASCAFQCAKRCRQNAAPLDDSCFAPCFAACG